MREIASVDALFTTKLKPSILATFCPLVTLTVCPDGVKFPLKDGEHCISVHLNTAPPHRQSGYYPVTTASGVWLIQ